MKRYILTCLFALAVACGASAQSHVGIAYSMGFATGDLGDYINKPSFRGISFDYRYEVQPNIGLGFNLGWNTFYAEEGYNTYTKDNASLTGKQYRYSNHAPMLATATYFLSPDNKIAPFFGIGLGTMYTRRNTDMNLYTIEEEAWNFALQPEAGLYIKVEDNFGAMVSLKYMNGFGAGDLDKTQSYFTLNLGVAFF